MAKQIDPIYKQYTMRVMKYLGSTEFYEYFMSMMEANKNTFQFSNRRVEKTVDETWVTAIEAVIKPMEEIINNPRNFIIQEEIIVNVALAKRITPDTVRHLAQHGSMIDTVTEDSVRPNRLMDKMKEDSWNTYENRFVYTLLDMAWEFVDKRYEAIFNAMGEEHGARLQLNSEMRTYHESVNASINLHIRQEEDLLSADEKNESIFARIARLHRVLGSYRRTGFYQEVKKFGRIKPPLIKTNAIGKNPNFKACHKLWNFMQVYNDVGYKINIIDQSSEIDQAFRQDMYNSILINYIILKNHLQDPDDRNLNINHKMKKKQIKPKFIKEIVEEITKNYDLPDVEVRKVLIEEITKAQLMQEEETERLRLVEIKEKEMEAKRKEEAKEQARLAREAEKERKRLVREQEVQALREEKERLRQEQLEQRRIQQFKQELEEGLAYAEGFVERRAKEEVAQQRRLKEEAKAKEKAEQERLAQLEAERLAEIAEKEAKEKAAEEEKARIADEKARIAEEKARIAAEKLAQREKEKAEKAKVIAKEKEKARLAKEKAKEKERLAKEKAKEKERLGKEKAKEKAKATAATAKKPVAKKAPPAKDETVAPEVVPAVAVGTVPVVEPVAVPEVEPVAEPVADAMDTFVADVAAAVEGMMEDEVVTPEPEPVAEPATEHIPEPIPQPAPTPEEIESQAQIPLFEKMGKRFGKWLKR